MGGRSGEWGGGQDWKISWRGRCKSIYEYVYGRSNLIWTCGQGQKSRSSKGGAALWLSLNSAQGQGHCDIRSTKTRVRVNVPQGLCSPDSMDPPIVSVLPRGAPHTLQILGTPSLGNTAETFYMFPRVYVPPDLARLLLNVFFHIFFMLSFFLREIDR